MPPYQGYSETCNPRPEVNTSGYDYNGPDGPNYGDKHDRT